MSAVFEYPQEQYRQMAIGDLVNVMRIEEAAYQFPWSLAIFRDCIKAGYTCWVAEINNNIIGYAVYINAVQECHLLNLCVDPKLQGKGFGRKLLAKVLDDSKENDARCIFLEVRPSNQHALLLYESEGFNEVGVRKKYYPTQHGREDAVIFAKEL